MSTGAPQPESRSNPPMRVLTMLERAALYLVAVLFLITGLGVLISTIVDVVREYLPWSLRLLHLMEGLLLAVIILEIYASVLIAVTKGRFTIEPFLVIGVVSALRHILAVGARGVLGPGSSVETEPVLVDLGVNIGMIFVLVLALTLIRWSSRWSSD